MREGARWWKGPDFLGLTMWRLLRYAWYLSLLRKNEPETLISSQRTTETFWPESAWSVSALLCSGKSCSFAVA